MIVDYQIHSVKIFRGVLIALNILIFGIFITEFFVDLQSTSVDIILPLAVLSIGLTVVSFYFYSHPLSRTLPVLLVYVLVEVHFVYNPAIFHVIIYWMPFIPIVSLLTNGIRSCFMWTALTIITNYFNYQHVKDIIGDGYPINVSTSPFLIAGIIFLLGLVAAASLLYYLLGREYQKASIANKGLQSSRERIETKNKEISKINAQLNSLNKNLEQLVQMRTAKLEEKNKKLKEYAFINSHLLRAPLSKILTIAQLLTEGTSADEKLTESLITSSKELDDIIREIGDLVHETDDED